MQNSVLPPRRPGVPAPDELSARRASLAALPGYVFDERVARSKQMFGGVSCLVLSPPHAVGTLVYFHGGGFRIGAPDHLAAFASQFAIDTGCEIVLPTYGLAPENPFPAALHDGLAVLKSLDDGRAIMIGGDSAGGNIATAVALLSAKDWGPRLRGLLLFSPWLDLTVRAESYTNNATTDPLFSRDAARQAADLYLQGHSTTDPLASPLFSDPSGLPPTLIVASNSEVLLDDSVSFAARLAAANVPMSLHTFANMTHVAVTLSPHYEGADQTMATAATFLKQRFAIR